MSGPGDVASRVERIRARLHECLHPLRLEIRDDSAAHAGHVGGGGKGHFRLLIVSEVFSGKTLSNADEVKIRSCQAVECDDWRATPRPVAEVEFNTIPGHATSCLSRHFYSDWLQNGT